MTIKVAQEPDEMELPINQDVIAVDLTAWRTGPLPVAELEALAATLFADLFPRADMNHNRIEMDIIRKAVIRQQVMFLQNERWNLHNAAERLTDESCRLAYGDRLLGSTIRNQVRDFAESYLEDLAKLFPRKLFWPREVEANAAEVRKESH